MGARKLLVIALIPGVLLAFMGCDDGDSARREMTIVVEADTDGLREREQELAVQFSEIEDERGRLLQERQALLSRMESGDDLSRLITEQRRLLDQEQQLRRQESLLDAERTAITEEVSRIVQAAASGALSSDGGGVEAAEGETARSPDLARRETGMANREADLAEREKALAEREAALALREAELARAGAAIAAAPSEPGRRVSSSMVETAHRRVRNTMRQRGLLVGDLPPEVAALDRQVHALSRRGRWAEALAAVESLSEAVDAIVVDEAFIQAKMERLGRARQGKSLSPAQAREVENLLSQATRAFADGKHADANARLNRISAILSN